LNVKKNVCATLTIFTVEKIDLLVDLEKFKSRAEFAKQAILEKLRKHQADIIIGQKLIDDYTKEGAEAESGG